jgi:hypothetical protein
MAKVIWFPDGRIITQRDDSPPAGLSQAERMNWIMKETSIGIDQGAADVRFVLDRVGQLNHDKQQFALAGAIDLGRLTAMGHSAGAEFAARACQQDSRLHACVDLDGAMVPVSALPLYGDDRKACVIPRRPDCRRFVRASERFPLALARDDPTDLRCFFCHMIAGVFLLQST